MNQNDEATKMGVDKYMRGRQKTEGAKMQREKIVQKIVAQREKRHMTFLFAAAVMRHGFISFQFQDFERMKLMLNKVW